MVLAKIDSTVVLDTLEVLVMHLGRVAEADNRMDIENLGLLFGQVTNHSKILYFHPLLFIYFRDFFGPTRWLR